MKQLDYTVLYAENDIAIKKNISLYLNIYYKTIIEANDVDSAYKLFKLHKPDLIITDLQLHKSNGLEFIKKVRDDDKNIPIIAIGAYNDKKSLLEAIKLNLCEYIIKPIKRNTLKFALENSLKKIDSFNNPTIFSLKTRDDANKEFKKIIQRKKNHDNYSGVIFIKTLYKKQMLEDEKEKIIQIITEIFSQNIREKDILIRWSEDKFLILLLDIKYQDILALATKLEEKTTKICRENSINLSCEFGLDEIEQNDTIEDILLRIETSIEDKKDDEYT